MLKKYKNPAYILLQLRDEVASDWLSLCKAVGIINPPREDLFVGESWKNLDSAAIEFLETLGKLHAAGLIIAEDPKSFLNGTITLSDNWPKIQSALKLSLRELAAFDQNKSMFVQPIWGRPQSAQYNEHCDLFVLMPFNDDIKFVYEDHIKSVAANLALKVKRADDFFTVHNVIEDLWSAICATRVVIADCTSRNPNVFYEIGLAHAVGKPVVLITQNETDVPFDLKHVRYIEYQITPSGMKDFEDKLTKTIETILAD